MQFLLPVFISLSLAFLTSCCSNCSFPWDEWYDDYDPNDVPEAPYVQLPPPNLSVHAEEVTAIVQEYAVELKKLKRLHLQHAKTYYNDEGIHTIQMEFISQDIIELCQARKLIVDVAEGYLESLNSNCLLIPEFTNQGFYPFNLEIYIEFQSYYIKYVDPFYIKWITMEDAVVNFYTGDVDDNEKAGWHKKTETYDTARNIVLYQRLAEDKFKAMHEPDRSIFGGKRFYPATHVNYPPLYTYPKVLE